MHTSARVLRITSLALWVGSIVFFAFALAPTAFTVLPNSYLAGLVVAGCLRILHGLGLVTGCVFLVAALVSGRRGLSRGVQFTLVCSMLAITGSSQFLILRSMRADQAAAGGDITSLAREAGPRADFDRLHHVSERLEGAVLLCGLLALALAAAEPTRPRFTER